MKLEAKCRAFRGTWLHRPAVAAKRVIPNKPQATHLSSHLGINSAQNCKYFTRSRVENGHLLVGLSKATSNPPKTLGRIDYLNIQIDLSVQIGNICSHVP